MHENLQYDFYYIRNRSPRPRPLDPDAHRRRRLLAAGRVLGRWAPDVSICIATYRRPEGLARLLASLARLKLAAEPSARDPRRRQRPAALGRRQCRSLGEFPHLVRWLEEPRRNIAHARNRAVDAAARALARLHRRRRGRRRALARGSLAAGCGRGMRRLVRARAGAARRERDAPGWTRQPSSACPRHPAGTLLGPGEPAARAMHSCGAALFEGRRFDPAFGRSGGEDSELFGRMLRAGARFCWCDEAIVTELVPAARHRLGWLAPARLSRRRGLHAARAAPAGSLAPRSCGAAARPWRGFCSSPRRRRWPRSRGAAAAARAWLRTCTQAGHLWALLGRGCEEYGAD